MPPNDGVLRCPLVSCPIVSETYRLLKYKFDAEVRVTNIVFLLWDCGDFLNFVNACCSAALLWLSGVCSWLNVQKQSSLGCTLFLLVTNSLVPSHLCLVLISCSPSLNEWFNLKAEHNIKYSSPLQPYLFATDLSKQFSFYYNSTQELHVSHFSSLISLIFLRT